MIKTYFINNFEELFALISEQPFDTEIKRYRSSFLYRGFRSSSLKTFYYLNGDDHTI